MTPETPDTPESPQPPPSPQTSVGATIQQRRRALGLTLEALAEAADCSKGYLSGIENARVANPPRPSLLSRLERALALPRGQLAELADWQTAPRRVVAEVRRLREQVAQLTARRADGSVNLDALFHAGALSRQADHSAGNLEAMPRARRRVPLINKVAAGYPTDFTDLDYPSAIADEYVPCAEMGDADVFAARVVGDSMLPEYREGDVIIFSPEAAAADGSDCFVRLLPDHHTTFKRVYFEADDRVRLEPLNRAYPARVVSLDEVSGLYPAVYRLQPIGRKG